MFTRLTGTMLAPPLLALAACLPHAAVFAAPTSQPTEPQLQAMLQRLESDDPDIRRNATAGLMIYPLAVPRYQQLAGDDNTSPETRIAVQHALELLEPKFAARAHRWEIKNRMYRWRAGTALEAYPLVGHHDPRWDEMALAALKLEADLSWNDTSAVNIGNACDKAIAAGCDDPLIVFLSVRAKSFSADADQKAIAKALEEAAEGMVNSGYSRMRVDAALADEIVRHWQLVRDGGSKEQLHLNRLALDMLPQAAHEADVTGEMIDLWAQKWKEGAGMAFAGAKGAIGELLGALDLALPNDPTPWIFRGRLDRKRAWEVRGGDFASNVAPEQFAMFDKILVEARDELQKGYAMDPTDPRAATEMITVEMGQNNGRLEMEKWFARAMATDPDNADACLRKMYYLEPKWHGGAEEMLVFGRQCLATERWPTDIPRMLVEAHLRLAEYEDSPGAYLRNPEVWRDFQSVFDGYLAARPADDARLRTIYAYSACECGQLGAAHTQFEALGDRAMPEIFGGRGRLDYWRRKATAAAVTGQPAN